MFYADLIILRQNDSNFHEIVDVFDLYYYKELHDEVDRKPSFCSNYSCDEQGSEEYSTEYNCNSDVNDDIVDDIELNEVDLQPVKRNDLIVVRIPQNCYEGEDETYYYCPWHFTVCADGPDEYYYELESFENISFKKVQVRLTIEVRIEPGNHCTIYMHLLLLDRKVTMIFMYVHTMPISSL